MPTPEDVAGYMLTRLEGDRVLHQSTVVFEIVEKYGEDFVYINKSGNQGIAKPVLDAFRKLTEDIAVWDKGERAWRYREDFDDPDKRAAD